MKDDYGSLKFAGQAGEASFNLEAAVVDGDAVTVTATAGTLGRGSDGGELLGIAEKIEGDDVGTVILKGSGRVVTAVRTGAISVGYVGLQVDGTGKVKAAASTQAKFFVIGTKTFNSVTYVTFVL
jgi:flagellar hook assembly protein FlgD